MEPVAILSLRESLGWTQRDLARELGVSPSTIAHWETGLRAPSGSARKLLSVLLGELQPPSQIERAPLQVLPRSLRGLPSAVLWLMLRGAFGDENRSPLLMRLRLAAVRRYAEELGGLRALAAKIGQSHDYLDLTLSDVEATVLRSLHKTAPAMPDVEVTRVFERELGAAPTTLFKTWERVPFACASIGQVHRAIDHDGRELAVKVQYPAIAAALAEDLRGAGALERLITGVLMGQTPGVIFKALAEHIERECDYVQEAAAQTRFKQLFHDRADICVPAVVPELSSTRVLTTLYEPGVALHRWSADEGQRARAGERVLRYYIVNALINGTFNTDPHQGNLLFREEAVVFLDYGRVQTLSADFMSRWKALLKAILERDRDRITATANAFGFISRPDQLDYDYGYRLLVRFYQPFPRDKPFHFTQAYLQSTWRAFLSDNPNKRFVSFPAEMAFFPQLFFGVYALLCRLNAPVACRAPILDALYGGEPRPPPYTDSELHLLLG